jgi:hypothetical protein
MQGEIRRVCESVRTAFVEPPSMFTIAMAFRNEFRVRISLQNAGEVGMPYSIVIEQKTGAYRGLISRSRSILRYAAARLHSLSFSSNQAYFVESALQASWIELSHNARSNVAGVLEEYGKERPSTSKTELIVLALSAAELCITN